MKFLIFTLISFHALAFDHDHKKWNDLLETKTKMEHKQTFVDYPSLKMDDEILKEYLSELESIKSKDFEQFDKNQKLAYWINAYNAYTIKLILDNYPVKSIKDLGSFLSTPWKKEFIPLLGKKLSLDDIEHKIIRKEFNEARIHFVVNCASISCPSLLREAIVAKKIDQQLEAATKHFLTNSTKNYYRDETLYLSKIFDWYEEDFKKSSGSVFNFVKKYMGINAKVEPKFRYLDYDWSLNGY